jgi:parallel beta-helix repeat protein
VLTAVDGRNNFVNNNTADQNANDGIEAQSGAVQNLIYENHATGNSNLDLADDNPTGCPNTWYHNTFGTSNKECIQ